MINIMRVFTNRLILLILTATYCFWEGALHSETPKQWPTPVETTRPQIQFPSPKYKVSKPTASKQSQLITIPSPSQVKLQRRQYQMQHAQLFPVKEFETYLNRLRQTGGTLNQIGFKRSHEELLVILPTGYYLFQEDCPLIKRKAEQIKSRIEAKITLVSFVISCLQREYQEKYMIRFLFERDDTRIPFFAGIAPGREMSGGVALKYFRINRQGLLWVWAEGGLFYRNPFMAVLQEEHGSQAEREFFQRYNISPLLPRLLKKAVALYAVDTRWPAHLTEVFQRADRLSFGTECPLQLSEPIRKLEGDGRYTVKLQISCIVDHPLAVVNLLLPSDSSEKNALAGLQIGQKFLAELKFGAILRRSGQYFIEWDSIYKLQTLNDTHTLTGVHIQAK